MIVMKSGHPVRVKARGQLRPAAVAQIVRSRSMAEQILSRRIGLHNL